MTQVKDVEIVNPSRPDQTVTEADIENYFNNYAIKTLQGMPAKIEKVNSSYRLDEYEKQKKITQELKNKVKIQAGKEATSLRKQFTKMQTMNYQPDNKEGGAGNNEKDHMNSEQHTQSRVIGGKAVEKVGISSDDFSETYKAMIHEMNEENRKVSFIY